MLLQLQCKDALRSGKRLLKEKNGAGAMVRFEKALMLSKALRERLQERRAERGLGAAARLQGQYKTAIKHLERVLEISREMNEYTGAPGGGARSPACCCNDSFEPLDDPVAGCWLVHHEFKYTVNLSRVTMPLPMFGTVPCAAEAGIDTT